MRITFQADADLDGRILRGLKRAAPEIDIRTATQAKLETLSDPQVLSIAARDGRVLVSQDRRTMPGHFQQFVKTKRSPGVLLLREGIQIVTAIEEIMLVWIACEPKELVDRLVWIPL